MMRIYSQCRTAESGDKERIISRLLPIRWAPFVLPLLPEMDMGSCLRIIAICTQHDSLHCIREPRVVVHTFDCIISAITYCLNHNYRLLI